MTATQWYCPPAVGYADRNSARLAARQRLQVPARTRPHRTATGPPDGRANGRPAPRAAQLLRMAKERPSMDHFENCRLKDWAWPICARCASSETGPFIMSVGGGGIPEGLSP